MHAKEFIKKNSQIEIPSIFMFKNQSLELYSFFDECRKANCRVYFKNENLLYDGNNPENRDNIRIGMYQMILADSPVLDNYLWYLKNIHEMTWDKNIKI